MNCADCNRKPATIRGVCPACYSKRVRQGTRDQLPPARRQPGKCDKGHPMEGDNIRHRKDGQRACRTCEKDRNRAAREKLRASRPPRPPRAPRPEPKPRKPKPTAPVSKLPPGWDRTTPPKVHPKPSGQKQGEIPPVKPTDPATLTKAARTVQLWWVLDPDQAAKDLATLGLVAS